jgi:hypothetical protein
VHSDERSPVYAPAHGPLRPHRAARRHQHGGWLASASWTCSVCLPSSSPTCAGSVSLRGSWMTKARGVYQGRKASIDPAKVGFAGARHGGFRHREGPSELAERRSTGHLRAEPMSRRHPEDRGGHLENLTGPLSSTGNRAPFEPTTPLATSTFEPSLSAKAVRTIRCAVFALVAGVRCDRSMR